MFSSSSTPELEWLDIVDRDDRVIGRAPRNELHGHPELRHRAVHVHVVDSGSRLLLQRRSWSKRIQPGRWDTAVGGHVTSGETYEQAAHREILEEIGIDGALIAPLFTYEWRTEIETEKVRTFLLRHDGPFRVPGDEIIALEWFDMARLRSPGLREQMTPNLIHELERLENTHPDLVGGSR